MERQKMRQKKITLLDPLSFIHLYYSKNLMRGNIDDLKYTTNF